VRIFQEFIAECPWHLIGFRIMHAEEAVTNMVQLSAKQLNHNTTGAPSRKPTPQPPALTQPPSRSLTDKPNVPMSSSQPCSELAYMPSSQPSSVPSREPSTMPSSQPSAAPSSHPQSQSVTMSTLSSIMINIQQIPVGQSNNYHRILLWKKVQ
jgi:hypothetical protein